MRSNIQRIPQGYSLFAEPAAQIKTPIQFQELRGT